MIKIYNNKEEMEKLMDEAFKNNQYILHNDHVVGEESGKLTIIPMPQDDSESIRLSILKKKIRDNTESNAEFKEYIKARLNL